MSDAEECAGEFSLVMPFTVCAGRGGPYDDVAFVAGYQCGLIEARLRDGEPEVKEYVPPALVPQIDLLAMRFGYSLAHYPDCDGWTLVELCREWAPD